MARKSRKTHRVGTNEVANTPVKEQKKVATAIYCRLSKADEITGRESMESQRNILLQFVEKKEELEVVAEYCDDGYSGTNFNRPRFEEMMKAIRDGKIKCLVVKDLSRLGRSYLETSDLLEMELPLYGCRFISVTDHIDTDIVPIDTIIVGLKNIMNQKFAEDISKKVKADFKERIKRGEVLGGPPIYGYKRNPENKGRLIIDEEAANVVRKIFDLKCAGKKDVQIARYLTAEGILTPKQYYYLKVKSVQPEEIKPWAAYSVRDIIVNEQYMGHVYHNKFKEKNYLGEKIRKQKRDKWEIYENVNPAIITKEVFEEAQIVRKQLHRRKES